MTEESPQQPAAPEVPAEPKASKHRPRRIIAVALVVLASLLVPIAATAGWAKRTVLDTDRFTSTVSDVALDADVTDAIATKLTDEIFALLATSSVVEGLPSVLDPVRPIIVGALESRVQRAVANVLDSDSFTSLFTTAVRQAHSTAIRVLEGESLTRFNAFSVEGNTITFDLRPLMLGVLQVLQDDGVLPSSIDIPSADDPPGAWASALGIDVPEDFGRVVVYSSENENLGDTLAAAQRGLTIAQRAWVAVWILAILLVAGAILVAVDRRRTVFRLGAGITLVSVLMIAASRRVAKEIPDHTTTPGARAIADALSETISQSLNRVLIILTIVAVLAAVFARYGGAILTAAAGHPDLANIVAVALAVGLLLVLGIGGGAILLALAVLAAGLVAVEYAKRRAETPAPLAAP